MRRAIVSDIHGNLEALLAVLKRLGQIGYEIGYEQLICLGDIVGYGADPSACLSLIRGKAEIVLMGNHDHAVAVGQPPDDFNHMAKDAISWTIDQLTQAEREWLGQLPYIEIAGQAFFSHGSPDKPKEFKYILDEMDASESFLARPHQLMFIGHSHQPLVFRKRSSGEIDYIPVKLFTKGKGYCLEEDYRYIINVGSVGQPRESNKQACFVVWDDPWVKYYRVDYDVRSAQAKIIKAGLPPYLAERLASQS
ncbi:MAG: metallophosphoesterase [Pseudomonadota bacterium]